MYCNNCGNELEAGAKFCTFCGASHTKSDTSEKGLLDALKLHKKALIVGASVCVCALAALIVVLIVSGQPGMQYGYDTPEEAAAAYVESGLEKNMETYVKSMTMGEIRRTASQIGISADATRSEYLAASRKYLIENADDFDLFIDYTITRVERTGTEYELNRDAAINRYMMTEEEYGKVASAVDLYVDYEPSEEWFITVVTCVEMDGRWYALSAATRWHFD